MTTRNPTTWMWKQACDLLDEAERLHRQFFRLSASHAGPVWEPPADVFENHEAFVVIVALPGVASDRIQVTLESGELVIRAERQLACPQHAGEIHRLEIPYGRFERSIPLPQGRLQAVAREVVDGCLVLRLQKLN
jgi:HSP20 family protein